MNSTNLKKRFIVAAIAVMMSVVSFAQNITGTVVDQIGEPIIGASVQVKGTQIGAVTDLNGRFSLSGGGKKWPTTCHFLCWLSHSDSEDC